MSYFFFLKSKQSTFLRKKIHTQSPHHSSSASLQRLNERDELEISAETGQGPKECNNSNDLSVSLSRTSLDQRTPEASSYAGGRLE